jgi:hypothetical protein
MAMLSCNVACSCVCRVRAAYKAVARPRDLEKELPQCGLGALLMSWLKQVSQGDFPG